MLVRPYWKKFLTKFTNPYFLSSIVTCNTLRLCYTGSMNAEYGILRSSGEVLRVIIENQLEKIPNDSFFRSLGKIIYKDKVGKIHNIFDLADLQETEISVKEAFENSGFIETISSDKKTLFLTKTPEEGWIRVWVPIKQQDMYQIRGVMEYYRGFENIGFGEVERMKIQVGGNKARNLDEKAVYFECNINEPGTPTRFPDTDPLVSKFASNNYGKSLGQLELPTMRR